MSSGPENPKRVLSFTDHLEEFRVRLIICVLFFLLSFLLGFFFAPTVIDLLIRPLSDIEVVAPTGVATFQLTPEGTLRLLEPSPETLAQDDNSTKALAGLLRDRIVIELSPDQPPIVLGAKSSSNLFYLSPIEPFMLLIKGALLFACVFSIPMTMYQLWLFIAPGLVRRERRIVKPILLSSFILFPMGVLFAYFISHAALKILMGISETIPSLYPNIVASHYIGFILTLMLVFGTVFEFPLVLILLSRLGIIESEFLARSRKWAMLIIAVISAAVTPSPDPFTMIMMMLPLVALYESSLFIIRLMERGGKKAAQPVDAK